MIDFDILTIYSENYFFDDNIIISKAECTIFCSMAWYCRVSFIPFWSCTIAIIPWPPSVLLAFSPAVCPPHHQHFFQSPFYASDPPLGKPQPSLSILSQRGKFFLLGGGYFTFWGENHPAHCDLSNNQKFIFYMLLLAIYLLGNEENVKILFCLAAVPNWCSSFLNWAPPSSQLKPSTHPWPEPWALATSKHSTVEAGGWVGWVSIFDHDEVWRRRRGPEWWESGVERGVIGATTNQAVTQK